MKRILTLYIIIFCTLACVAQEMTYRFETTTSPIARSFNKTHDTECAALVVRIPRAVKLFESAYLDQQNISPFENGQYILYLNKGAKKLQVYVEGYNRLEVDISKEIGGSVEPNVTYMVTINMPQAYGMTEQDDGKSYVVLSVSPANAQVSIDDKDQQLDSDGVASVRLNRGSHTLKAHAAGYSTLQKTFTLGNEKLSLPVKLQSVMASLSITCPTSGASVYINDQRKGQSPWSGQLMPGDYLVEVRLDGYQSQKKSIILAERASENVTFSQLVARTGLLDVNFKPIDSEVWLDGKKLGTSPDVFRNIIIGSHKVSIRKSGYTTKEQTVTITEGQTATLTGTLERATPTSPSSTLSQAGAQTFTVNGVSFNMIPVEGGTFTMGATSEQQNPASDEKPTHQVTLSSYMIGETEVTQALWQAVMGSNPSKFKGDSQRPVEQVSWNDCQSFISKLNSLTGKRFSLPTEAQWEYAARGGKMSRGYQYSGSNSLDDVAWYDKNSYDKGASSPDYGTHRVKTKKANELGIYDMSGNVWEWCSDWYGNYNSSAQTSPTGPTSGSTRVGRGGSWYINARICRSAIRDDNSPDFSYCSLGLRLCLSE